MKPILEYNDYLQDLLQEIERLKGRNRNSLFRVNDKMSKGTAEYVKNYFNNKPEYGFEIRTCAQCTGKYDIIITFHNI